MATLKFAKVASLPATLVPSTMYLVVDNSGKLKIYLTDKNAQVEYHTYDSTEIATLVNLLIESQKGQPNGIAGLDANGNIIGGTVANVDGAFADLQHNGNYVWKTFTEQLIYRNINGGSNPSWGTLFGNQQGLLFDGTGLTQTWCDIVVPNDVLVGGSFYLSLPFITLAAGTGTVRFGIEYHVSKGFNQSQFPISATSVIIDTALTGNQARRPYNAITPLQSGVNIEPGSIIKARIYRDGGADTNNNDVHLNVMQFHYMTARIGTVNPQPPFLG